MTREGGREEERQMLELIEEGRWLGLGRHSSLETTRRRTEMNIVALRPTWIACFGAPSFVDNQLRCAKLDSRGFSVQEMSAPSAPPSW